MTSPKDLERLLASAAADGADWLGHFQGLLDDPDVDLTEEERSRERIIMAFQVAAVEGVNAECARGMAANDAVVAAARAAGIAIGLLLVQGYREKGWPKVRKELLGAMRRGMMEIERQSRGGGG